MPDANIEPHPDRERFLTRVLALGRTRDRPGAWELFRFIDPRFSSAADIISGEGALHAAGRWHSRGALRLAYTATQPEFALAETLAHARYFRLPPATALPRVLVSLSLRADRLLDLRDGALRRNLRLSLETIRTTDWRQENRRGREAVTQAWGAVFGAAGFEAVIVPSAAGKRGTNVLVFPENLRPGSRFTVDREVEWT